MLLKLPHMAKLMFYPSVVSQELLLSGVMQMNGFTQHYCHGTGAEFKSRNSCNKGIFFYYYEILFRQSRSRLLKFLLYAVCFWALKIFYGSRLFHQLKKWYVTSPCIYSRTFVSDPKLHIC